jgi:ATP-dependent Clp protease ATP-binding subunit ClpA
MMIRLDMSEYQNSFDLTRILSRGNGHSFLDQLSEKPHSVIVFDEIEKASPDILNILLQILEEGMLTDSGGGKNYFTETIIIATSNAGDNEIRSEIEKGHSLEEFESEFINHLIDSRYFRPELLNRFDDIVLFRPLNTGELKQIAGIIIANINKNLAKQNLSLTISDAGLDYLVSIGYDPRLGSRPLRRAISARVENKISQMVLSGQTRSGMNLHLDEPDLH